MEQKTKEAIAKAQRNELTEHIVYRKIASMTKDSHNKNILQSISKDELKHYKYWKSLSKKDERPKRLKIWFYVIVSHIFGLSFGLRLMEKGEETAQEAYRYLAKRFSEGKDIIMDEQKHEKQLLGLLEDENLEYASSIVLGLNDALVKLTGALAGFTFALRNGKLIAITGLITGIAASMSMAASGYLSSREEEDGAKKPVKSALYTGGAYIITVIFLIIPFFLIPNVFIALGITLAVALLVIFGYTMYITTAKGKKFWPRFIEMALISLGVAAISFAIGYVVDSVFNVNV
jgi:VIT1/CCC1 family predicted Fe2+/Mn2+ transporter